MRLISQVGISRSASYAMEQPSKKRSPPDTSNFANIYFNDAKTSANAFEISSTKRKKYQAVLSAASKDEINDVEDKKIANRKSETNETERARDDPTGESIFNASIYPELLVSHNNRYQGRSDTSSNLHEISHGFPFQESIQNLVSRLLSHTGENQALNIKALSNDHQIHTASEPFNLDAVQSLDLFGLRRGGDGTFGLMDRSNAVTPQPLLPSQQLIGNIQQPSNLLSSVFSNPLLQQNLLFIPQSLQEAPSDLLQQLHQRYMEAQQQEQEVWLRQPTFQQFIYNLLQQIQLRQQSQPLQELMPSPQVLLLQFESTAFPHSVQTSAGHQENPSLHPPYLMQIAVLLEQSLAMTMMNSRNDGNSLQIIQSALKSLSSPHVQQPEILSGLLSESRLHNVDINIASVTKNRGENYAKPSNMNDGNSLQIIQSVLQSLSSSVQHPEILSGLLSGSRLQNFDNKAASVTNTRGGNYANPSNSLSEAATLTQILSNLPQNSLGSAFRPTDGREFQAARQAPLPSNVFGSSFFSSQRDELSPEMKSNTAYSRVVNEEKDIGISLSVPTDTVHLSDYQILLRQQLEFFTAKTSDAESNIQGRKKRVRVGQVGIRCCHCSNLPVRQRGRGAVYYTTKLSGVYQAAQNMAVSHLSKSCSIIPEGIRQSLLELHNRRDTAGGGKQYWADCCQNLGLYDDDGGILFKST